VSAFRRVLRRPLGAAGLVVLLVLTIASIAAPWVAPFDPNAIDLRAMQQPPGGEHLLGTDDLGRDVLTRVLYAGRVSLALAALVTGFAVLIGCTLGALAGFHGGWIDRLVSLAADSMLSVPALGLAMVAGAILRPNVLTLAVVLALVTWPDLARITRAQVLTLRERTYAEAAQALGNGPSRILFRHLLPNALAPLVVAATLLSANVLLIESALSFLGYGMRPPTPSWGGMLFEAQAFYRQSPWLAVVPGVTITLTVTAINLLGDAMREASGGRGPA
jgi:peptide/nickel transport system permease protein